jgi:hypothetical protein
MTETNLFMTARLRWYQPRAGHRLRCRRWRVAVEFADMSSEILGRDKNAPLAQRNCVRRTGRHMF